MLFNSFDFAVFFPLAAGVYFALPRAARWAWLLAASYVFYMAWEPGYVVLLWISTLVDYAAALCIATARGPGRRRWLLMSLGVNLGLLGVFKYYNFFRESLKPLAAAAGLHLELPHSEFLLPVGISFYTFQTLSYTIEVYRGNLPAERHLGRFALYVAFFPQLVAGPIERAGRLLPQLRRFADFDEARVVDGLRRMAWGLFKKVVIADRLALIVDPVYADPHTQPGPVLAAATVAFAFQIYCDFSGYSDIAVGAARIFGVRLMENFQRPYFAASLTDFWRRWHISLSTWFRDYLYIPLGGNRGSAARWSLNIGIVFLLSGLWHGANWTYVVWGGMHGAALIVERLAGASGTPAPWRFRVPRMALTFAWVCVAWVFFRAASAGEALAVLQQLPTGWAAMIGGGINLEVAFGLPHFDLVLAVALVAGLVGAEALQAKGIDAAWLDRRPAIVRWALYSALGWAIFLLGVLREQEFIYFVF